MRTTLTLDDDVAALLQRALRRRGATLKGVVNAALRAGLPRLERQPTRARYRTKPVHLGKARMNLDNIAEVLAIAETDAYR